MMRLTTLFVLISCISTTLALTCWTCDTKCGCRNPVAEQCPSLNKCYTLKSLTNGDIVKKGCARECLTVNQNDKFCESCDSDRCNSEQSLAPMNNEYDECQSASRLQPLAFNSGIGQGTGYGGPNIGSGTGYNPGGIGSGTGYNGPYNDGQAPRPNSGIGSGTGYNPGIGSGTGYNPGPVIGSGTGGNYYPAGNEPQYPNGRYGNIGTGTWNSASGYAFQIIPISICLLLAQAL